MFTKKFPNSLYQALNKNNLSVKQQPLKLQYWCYSLSVKNAYVPTLNDEDKTFLEKNGYLHLKNFVPLKVAQNLRTRMMNLLNNLDPSSTKSTFRSHRTDQEHKDKYFLESGDKIYYFWEENVFDNNGKLNRPKQYAINKIGHALHTLDPYFKSYVYGYLPQIAYDVGLKEPTVLQSMYICKQPGIGGEVNEHQDSTFLYTEPMSCYGFWLPIDETTKSNGCVWVIPESHTDKNIGLKNRFKRISNDETTMTPLIGKGELPKTGGVPIETKAGDLLILHGLTVHWSEQNKSNDPRHALMIHCIDNKCHYPADNWLQYSNNKPFPLFTKQDVSRQVETQQLILNPQDSF